MEQPTAAQLLKSNKAYQRKKIRNRHLSRISRASRKANRN